MSLESGVRILPIADCRLSLESRVLISSFGYCALQVLEPFRTDL